jgi:hypothetical protein
MDREQKVKTKSPNNTQKYFSNWETITYGIPHGLILGPLLFIILYIFKIYKTIIEPG